MVDSTLATGVTGEHLWLQSPGAAQRRLRLLQAIEHSGSISQGAKVLRVSYKTAWSLVETMNNLSPQPLVERTVGGRSGGGTQLTASGREFLKALKHGAARYERLLTNKETAVSPEESNEELGRISAEPSTRWVPGLLAPNQYLATLRSIAVHPEQVLAVLELVPGQTIFACGARGTFTARMRAAGHSVLAHINPSAILLSVGSGVLFSADNQLWGTIKRLRRGPVQSEVTLQLPLERVLTVLITSGSADRLGLRLGLRVLACFSAEAVTILST